MYEVAQVEAKQPRVDVVKMIQVGRHNKTPNVDDIMLTFSELTTLQVATANAIYKSNYLNTFFRYFLKIVQSFRATCFQGI